MTKPRMNKTEKIFYWEVFAKMKLETSTPEMEKVWWQLHLTKTL